MSEFPLVEPTNPTAKPHITDEEKAILSGREFAMLVDVQVPHGEWEDAEKLIEWCRGWIGTAYIKGFMDAREGK